MSKMFRLTKTKNYFCFENFCISMISITQITVIMLKGKNYTFYCQSILCHQTHFISVCMYLLTDTLFTNCQQFILNHSIKHEKSVFYLKHTYPESFITIAYHSFKPAMELRDHDSQHSHGVMHQNLHFTYSLQFVVTQKNEQGKIIQHQQQ